MPEFKIICDERRREIGAQCYTFTVDGVPSMKWCHCCNLDASRLPSDYDGPAAEYYIRRVITRLKQGRSTEAFGGMVAAVRGVRVMTKSGQPGRGTVQAIEAAAATARGGATARQQFTYVLDGKRSDQAFATEEQARAACAIAAFMTRGKLGRLQELEAALRAAYPDQEVRVWACPNRHRVCATVGGHEVAIGWDEDGPGHHRFKLAGGARPIPTKPSKR